MKTFNELIMGLSSQEMKACQDQIKAFIELQEQLKKVKGN